MSASSKAFLAYQQESSNYDSCEWAEFYYQQQVEAEYYQSQEAAPAPIVAMYTDLKPAPAVAVAVPVASPLVEQLVKHQDAIQSTLSELNVMLLNAATPALRSQVKAIATGLVAKSGLMDDTKTNYLQMLEAAEANAAMYYGNPLNDGPFEPEPVTVPVSPYKRKYSNAAEIARHLATTSTLKEVASLYYVNAEMVEAMPQLKKEFTNRKAIFYNKAAA